METLKHENWSLEGVYVSWEVCVEDQGTIRPLDDSSGGEIIIKDLQKSQILFLYSV